MSRLPSHRALVATLSAILAVICAPAVALAMQTPQIVLPDNIAKFIDTARPIVIALIVVYAFYVVIMGAVNSLGALASGKGTVAFRSSVEGPLAIATIVLISVVFLYSFIDLLNAALAWLYSLI